MLFTALRAHYVAYCGVDAINVYQMAFDPMNGSTRHLHKCSAGLANIRCTISKRSDFSIDSREKCVEL